MGMKKIIEIVDYTLGGLAAIGAGVATSAIGVMGYNADLIGKVYNSINESGLYEGLTSEPGKMLGLLTGTTLCLAYCGLNGVNQIIRTAKESSDLEKSLE